jgi:adenylate kinase family enzyme
MVSFMDVFRLVFVKPKGSRTVANLHAGCELFAALRQSTLRRMGFRVHITGASGSGTTTLGRALATRAEVPLIDSDDVFWLPTDPPYQTPRERPARQAMLLHLTEGDRWVLSGSIVSWGDVAIARFDLAVCLTAPTELRLQRLRAPELARFGAAALAPGGAMHENHAEFVAWAAKYDTAGPEMRSRHVYEEWLTKLSCPVLRLDGTAPTAEQIDRVLAAFVR